MRVELGFKPRTCLKVSRVLEIIRTEKIIDPAPSRQTIVNRITDGTLEGKHTSFGYVVYLDSFKAWVLSLQP